jgi:phosphoribosylglycinamide formyltransferase 1
MSTKKMKIVIFASGNGTNAAQLIKHFHNHSKIQVALIVTNSNKAGVVKVAVDNNIPFSVINKSLLANNGYTTALLNLYDIDFIVLAGFLLLMPPFLVKLYDQKMINIHPALLPKYGGKGMYGMNVHQAVINEMYDRGKIIFQAKCKVDKKDNAEKLARKVQELEHKYYPEWTEKLVLQTRFL